MAGITASLLAGIAAPAIGGALGSLFSEGDRDKAVALQQQAFKEIQDLGLAPDQAIPLMLEKFKSAGMYTPELEEAIKTTPSLMQDVKTDPGVRDAQMAALGQLQQKSRTGFAPEDEAALNKVRRSVSQDMQAKTGQILQNAQARGQGGAGSELIAQLQAAQSGADREADMGLDIAGQASQRALQALSQSTGLANQLRESDFSEASQRAKAQDVINQFNTQNSIGTQQRNIGAQNQGQQSNLSNQQQILDANTRQANAEQQRQLDGKVQNYKNAVQRAQMRAGAYQGQAGISNQQAQNTQNLVSGLGNAAGAGFNAIGGQQVKASDAAAKATQTPDKFKAIATTQEDEDAIGKMMKFAKTA